MNDAATDELLKGLASCPFCASGPERFYRNDSCGEDPDGTYFERVMVECENCHASAPLEVWPALRDEVGPAINEGDDDAG